jgi:hypothetical protein
MKLKPIAAIAVLLLVVASLLISYTLTITQKPATAPSIPTYPNKRLNYGQLFGRVSCEPGWQNDTKFLPTDGSGSTTFYDCSGNAVNYPTGTSNQLQYMVQNGWDMELDPTSYMLSSYPRELATLGAGHTQMDAFKNTYVALMDKTGMKWWLEISDVMNDQSILTYQTPGNDSLSYKPASGMATSYESSFGAALDYIEHNCSTNFQGYTFEQAYTNGVMWLHNRTNYSVSEKNWNAWINNTDGRGVNTLMGTNPNGTDITPMPTPLQRIGLLDELVVEIFDQRFYDTWSAYLPVVGAAYPNLPIVLNVDQVCAQERWSNGAPIGSGSDAGWWAPQGLGEPNNRCYYEQLGALQRIHRLYEINGKPFDGIIYNFYGPAFPEGGSSIPDITWFLQWADTLHVTNPVQTPQVKVSVDGGGTQSLNFEVSNNGTPAWVYLQLYAGGNVTNLPNATVTFNVAGTSISKTTADNTIFFALPTTTVANPDPPGFIIRLFPEELSALATGSHGYTLVVTTSYGVKTFNGSMTV